MAGYPAAVIVGLIAGIALVVLFSTLGNSAKPYESITSNITRTSLTSQSQCQNTYQMPSFSQPSSNARINTPVFLMKEGQSAKVCLEYKEEEHEPVRASILTKVFTSNGADTNPTNKIHMTGKILNITASTASIVYNLTSESNSKGVYRIIITEDCAGLPFAVGYDSAKEINESEFAWMEGTYNCPSITGKYSVTGTTGLDVQGHSLNVTQ